MDSAPEQNKVRGRPKKYATPEEKKAAQREQIKKYKKNNPEKNHTEINYFGYNKTEIITETEKEKFKENLPVYLKFKASYNFLYKKYPEIMDELFNDKSSIIIKN